MRERVFDRMAVLVGTDIEECASAAAADAAAVLSDAVARRGAANAMFATGNSQIRFLEALVRRAEVPWGRVVVFHMDEYVGVGADHPAGFRRYITDRIVEEVRPREAHLIHGDAPDPEEESRRYSELLRAHPLDLCCLGIGENGHLAFNDPPVADFEDPLRVKVVELDRACRAQQVGEGHFASIEEVPTHAITATIPTLLGASRVVAVVPEARKAEPVAAALTGPVTTGCPASVLRTRGSVRLYLDEESAAGLAR
jgi:glucosamine-6-phosphate deaminase